jgi:hypothetical protein
MSLPHGRDLALSFRYPCFFPAPNHVQLCASAFGFLGVVFCAYRGQRSLPLNLTATRCRPYSPLNSAVM